MKQLSMLFLIALCSFEYVQAQGAYGVVDIRAEVNPNYSLTESETEDFHYTLFSAIKLKPDGVQETGPSNIILGPYPEYELIHFQKHTPDPGMTKRNSNFNFSYFPEIGMFAQNSWDTVAPVVHGVTLEVRDLDMNLSYSFAAEDLGHQEIRPHVLGCMMYQGDTLFYTLMQDWMDAQDFNPNVSYPYYFANGGDSITATTVVNREYLVVFTPDGSIVKDIDVSQYVTYDDMDFRQYRGIEYANPVLHLNNVDVAIRQSNGEPIFALSSRNTNKAFFLDWSGNLVFRFPDDGYKLESGGYAAWTLNLSRPHGLVFQTDIVDETFQMSWYNNGGQNTIPAAEPLGFEINVGDPNPENRAFTYGKLWGYTNFDVTSKELGNTYSFGNVQFINYGRIDNDAPTEIMPKLEWRDKANTNIVYAQIFLNEFRKETFNTEHHSSELFGFIEEMRPEMWVENDRLYATSGYDRYLWFDGVETVENSIELPTINPDSLGVAVPYGDDNGWITAPKLTLSEVLSVSDLSTVGVRIYPNHVVSGEVINITGPSQQNIMLHDMSGRTWSLQVDHNLLQLPQLASGLYLVTVIDEKKGRTSSSRLVVH